MTSVFVMYDFAFWMVFLKKRECVAMPPNTLFVMTESNYIAPWICPYREVAVTIINIKAL